MTAIDRIVTLDDLRKAAKRRLPRMAYDFIEGGVEDERALTRNEESFSRYRLVPRYFLDVSRRSQQTTIFGRTYDSPFGLCPTGAAGLWRPRADSMLAQAAAEANIPSLLSTVGNCSIETLLGIAPKHMWFQLYPMRDRSIGDRLVTRVRDLGVETLVVTADVPVAPNRERNVRSGFSRPLRLTPRTVMDAVRHPFWLCDYLRDGGKMPMLGNLKPYAASGATSDDVADLFAKQIPCADATWSDFERWRKLWPGKLVVKGILHPDDAVRAVDLGADGIIVSNHGGRQLDCAPSPLEMLPVIRAEVGPEPTLMLDSGIRRGTDILVALCLGAQFVFVGRPALYGVAAFGLSGARKMIDILKREVQINLGQIGCTAVRELDHRFLLRHHLPTSIGDERQFVSDEGRGSEAASGSGLIALGRAAAQ